MQEVVILQVTVPIMQRRAADRNPHCGAHAVHDRVRQLAVFGRVEGIEKSLYHKMHAIIITRSTRFIPFMLGGAETVGNQLHSCVYEKSDKHTRCHDFHVRVLLLVQVPCAANAEEITTVAGPVQNDDNQIDHLNKYIEQEKKNTVRTPSSPPIISTQRRGQHFVCHTRNTNERTRILRQLYQHMRFTCTHERINKQNGRKNSDHARSMCICVCNRGEHRTTRFGRT